MTRCTSGSRHQQGIPMSNVILNGEEVEALRVILSKLVIRERSGEIGITHGMDRFVSTQLSLRKDEKKLVAGVYRKLGATLREVPR